jgi:hypothetical protein
VLESAVKVRLAHVGFFAQKLNGEFFGDIFSDVFEDKRNTVVSRLLTTEESLLINPQK